jgi:integrase
MGKYPGLRKRGSRWVIRVTVPKDLVDAVGHREIWRSLRTSEQREAVSRYFNKRAEIERIFNIARHGPPELTEADARAWIVDWFHLSDRFMADADYKSPDPDLPETIEELEAELVELTQSEIDAGPVGPTPVEEILIAQGWPAVAEDRSGPIKPLGVVLRHADVDRASVGYVAMLAFYRRAQIELRRRSLARLRGEPAGEVFDQLFNGPQARTETDQAVMLSGHLSAPESPTLTEIFAKWKVERRPAEKTLLEWDTSVRRFVDICGDLAVDNFSKAHLRKFRDTLVNMPSHVSGPLREMTVPQVVAATKGKRLARIAPATVKKQVNAIGTLLAWCVNNGYLEDNPAKDLTVSSTKSRSASRRLPYTAAELKKLFAGLEEFKVTAPEKYWIPLLAAYTGARMEELGQLRVADIRKQRSIDFIDINTEDEGKHLKTASARREVPLHPALIERGFLTYVKGRERTKDDRLFPNLEPDREGRLTNRFSKWFTRYRRKCGVNRPGKVFHSFRHTFKKACREAGVEEEVHDAITGHSGGGVGRSYGGVPLVAKSKALRKMRYERLN